MRVLGELGAGLRDEVLEPDRALADLGSLDVRGEVEGDGVARSVGHEGVEISSGEHLGLHPSCGVRPAGVCGLAQTSTRCSSILVGAVRRSWIRPSWLARRLCIFSSAPPIASSMVEALWVTTTGS